MARRPSARGEQDLPASGIRVEPRLRRALRMGWSPPRRRSPQGVFQSTSTPVRRSSTAWMSAPRSGSSVTRIRSSASTTARLPPSSSSSEARARLSAAPPRRRWTDGPAAPERGLAARGLRGARPPVGQASSPCSASQVRTPGSDGGDDRRRPDSGRSAVSEDVEDLLLEARGERFALVEERGDRGATFDDRVVRAEEPLGIESPENRAALPVVGRIPIGRCERGLPAASGTAPAITASATIAVLVSSSTTVRWPRVCPGVWRTARRRSPRSSAREGR